MKPVFIALLLFTPLMAFSEVETDLVCKSVEAVDLYLEEAQSKKALAKVWEAVRAYLPIETDCSKRKVSVSKVRFSHYNIVKKLDSERFEKIEIYKGLLEEEVVFFFSPPCKLDANCADKLEWVSEGPLDLCKDFPEISKSSLPDEVTLGKPFEYKLRFSCDLGDRYVLKKVQGGFEGNAGVQSVLATIRTEQLPSNESIISMVLSFPQKSFLGGYTFKGCLKVVDLVYAKSICIKLEELGLNLKK